MLLFQIFDIAWDPFQLHRLVSCGVKHIKVRPGLSPIITVTMVMLYLTNLSLYLPGVYKILTMKLWGNNRYFLVLTSKNSTQLITIWYQMEDGDVCVKCNYNAMK